MCPCRAADPSDRDVHNPNPNAGKSVISHVHVRQIQFHLWHRAWNVAIATSSTSPSIRLPVQRHSITQILQDDESLPPTTLSKMSVLLETSAGDIVIDLLVDYAPRLCEK